MKRRTVAGLNDLLPLVQRTEGFSGVVTALKRGGRAAIEGAWGSACAMATAALSQQSPSLLLFVTPRIGDVEDQALDLLGFLDDAPHVFPAWDALPSEHRAADGVFGGRLRVLQMLRELQLPGVSPVVVTSFPALMQPAPSRTAIDAATRRLGVGEDIDVEVFLQWLVERGFERTPAIELPGEFSMRGGILDLFPPGAEDPLRIELFGEEIESIRRFDVETQRRVQDLQECRLTLIAPGQKSRQPDSPSAIDDRQSPHLELSSASLLDHLPADAWIVLSELDELVDEGKAILRRLDDPRGMLGVDAVLGRCARFPLVTISALSGGAREASCRLSVESIERFTGPKSEVLQELAVAAGRDERVLIPCHNQGERQRLGELLAESAPTLAGRVDLCLGRLNRGFRLVADRLAVISDHELFGRTEVHRAAGRKRRPESRAIDSFLDLKQGDLVVHLTQGIGRYRGMRLLEKDDRAEEHLVLELRDRVKIFVPVSLIHLVQKYIGAARAVPQLSRVNGTAWAKKKGKVANAVTDLASDMIRFQAERKATPGIAFPPDSHWQQEFDASFPYTETPDQVDAIADAKADMQTSRPMDRLICGDVGYGKTEVAMRAAFKAIESGRQVAVLVPTTVLAEQHFRTFCERMAEYPFNVEVLSRFRTKREQRQIIERLRNGGADVVIGTHRLVQKDVQFKDLGLLIIDEEQRFGVDAKEMLKRLRLEVDVLTMSATPIPRTLHMSLLGIRDISNLTTPPVDRRAIETRICRWDPELIRMAVVRELNRGGQAYFVHNRVYNIEDVAEKLKLIVPEATFDVGHGQMPEHHLESAMYRFVAGQTDVLVCTTIIESGLDIPNANTIFIHQAGIYGLADMHQLRGRVGRYRHRAFCYLMLEEGRTLTTAASRRLKAIEEFSELGAGFKIAMRDLEIRGAGNVLGTEQSGHISTVGYELYCQLLENAARKLKNEPLREYRHVELNLPVDAWLPEQYIPAGRQKIEVYRRISQANSREELDDLQDELRDRFGAPPEPANAMLELRRLQLDAFSWGIGKVHLEDGYAVFTYGDSAKISSLKSQLGKALRLVDGEHAYLPLSENERKPAAIVAALKSLLQQSG